MPKRVFKNPNELLTGDVAEYIGVKLITLLKALQRGAVPEPAQRRGNKRIWTREEADELKRLYRADS